MLFQPGKPGKVGEFDSGQEKSGKCVLHFCLWCVIAIAMVGRRIKVLSADVMSVMDCQKSK